jgi:hypothetical protein
LIVPAYIARYKNENGEHRIAFAVSGWFCLFSGQKNSYCSSMNGLIRRALASNSVFSPSVLAAANRARTFAKPVLRLRRRAISRCRSVRPMGQKVLICWNFTVSNEATQNIRAAGNVNPKAMLRGRVFGFSELAGSDLDD